MNDDRARFQEIRKQIASLNLEAEKILLAHKEGSSKGYGRCEHFPCACAGYIHGDTPAVCGRSHCGHWASEHAF